jgi:hypothetical protein
MPRLTIDYDMHDLMQPHAHGTHAKSLLVLHETVSPDLPGLIDVKGVAKYLADKDYGIHGISDKEGNIAWAKGLGNAIFWQAGGVNTESEGIEQVSNIPSQLQKHLITKDEAYGIWLARTKQLAATAKLAACWHNADQSKHPLRYSDSTRAGVTSHWDVSQHHPESEGHSDCWPRHKGGYFPILIVIHMAQAYAEMGLTF